MSTTTFPCGLVLFNDDFPSPLHVTEYHENHCDSEVCLQYQRDVFEELRAFDAELLDYDPHIFDED